MNEPAETIVLCMNVGPSSFDDNAVGPCADCGAGIMWRPHVPDGAKVCLLCGMARIKANPEPPEFVITQKTADELEALGYLVKRCPRVSVQ